MSNQSFAFGNSIFKAFLNQTATMIKPHSHLVRFASAADLKFPNEPEGASAFTKQCISSLKKKASMLASICPGQFSHTKRLDLVANMCFFPSWKNFLEFTQAFPNLPEPQRKTTSESLKLCACLWKITGNQGDLFTLGYMAASGIIFSQTSGIDLDTATTIVRRIFSDESASSTGEVMQSHEIIELIEKIHEGPVEHYLMQILMIGPFRNGKPSEWENLVTLSVENILKADLTLEDPLGDLPIPADEMLAAMIMSDIHKYAEKDLTLTPVEKRRIISCLNQEKTRAEVHIAISDLTSEISKRNVLSVVAFG